MGVFTLNDLYIFLFFLAAIFITGVYQYRKNIHKYLKNRLLHKKEVQELFEIENNHWKAQYEDAKQKIQPLREFMTKYGAINDAQILQILTLSSTLSQIKPSLIAARVIYPPKMFKNKFLVIDDFDFCIPHEEFIRREKYEKCHRYTLNAVADDQEKLLIYFGWHLKEIKQVAEKNITFTLSPLDDYMDLGSNFKGWTEVLNSENQLKLGMSLDAFWVLYECGDQVVPMHDSTTNIIMVMLGNKIYSFEEKLPGQFSLVEILSA